MNSPAGGISEQSMSSSSCISYVDPKDVEFFDWAYLQVFFSWMCCFSCLGCVGYVQLM